MPKAIKARERKLNFLSRAFSPFLRISACGSRCGSKLSHTVTHRLNWQKSKEKVLFSRENILHGNRCSVTTSMSRYAGKKTGKKIADEETAQKIIAALENESIKYETYFKLIIATGMRRGECCALQWRDIDREQLNIHSLRHTAASLMIAGGADMATVAGILGHSQLSATPDIYTHARTKKPPAQDRKGCLRYDAG